MHESYAGVTRPIHVDFLNTGTPPVNIHIDTYTKYVHQLRGRYTSCIVQILWSLYSLCYTRVHNKIIDLVELCHHKDAETKGITSLLLMGYITFAKIDWLPLIHMFRFLRNVSGKSWKTIFANLREWVRQGLQTSCVSTQTVHGSGTVAYEARLTPTKPLVSRIVSLCEWVLTPYLRLLSRRRMARPQHQSHYSVEDRYVEWGDQPCTWSGSKFA